MDSTHALDRTRLVWPGCFDLRIAVLGLALLGASSQAGLAQLTVSDNERFREDDFDVSIFAAGNRFGSSIAACDFTGDGFDDLAIGSPFGDFLGLIADVGAAHVAFGGPEGLTLAGHQTFTQPPAGVDPPELNDNFGSSLAAGDFDGDGRCDLAVGAIREVVDGVPDAGSVHVFEGTASGIASTSTVWTQNTAGIQDFPEQRDLFSSRLAAGDFDDDGNDDLAISALGENAEGGAVHILFGSSPMGLLSSENDLLYQGGAGGGLGSQEALDRFGQALAVGHFNADAYADLAIGVPGEGTDMSLDDYGWVQVFYADADSGRFLDRQQDLFDQSDLGEQIEDGDEFGASLAAGDFNGDGLDDLAIGSPGEDVDVLAAIFLEAGAIAVLYSTPTGLSVAGAQVLTQESSGVSDGPYHQDHFGQALAAGDFDGDGYEDLAIGVPGEDFSGLEDNGALHVIYGSPLGLTTEREQFHGQTVWHVGASENDDRFGSVMTSGDFDGNGVSALVVGVPEENLSGEPDAGLVALITGIDPTVFDDGFESGDLSAWSASVQ